MLLTMANCLWLYYASKAHVSFSLTVVVAAAITLCGGFVTSVRANGLFRRGEQAVVAERAVAREREVEFDQLVFKLPALFYAFATLWPDRTQNGQFTMHEFSNWLRWALRAPHANIVDWMMERPDSRGRRQMLRGITGHVRQEDRQVIEMHIDRGVQEIIAEMGLYAQSDDAPVQRRSHRRQDDSSGRRQQRGQHRHRDDRQPVPV